MQALLGSLLGIFGTPQLHTVLLLGMLALAAFRPERIGSWLLFRRALVLFVAAVALPGVGAAFAGDVKGAFESDLWIFKLIVPAVGVLTGGAMYCLVSSISPTAPADAS